jgi:putative transposase
MVTPAARREAAAHLEEVHGVSERRACQALDVDRSSVRYRSRRADDAPIRTRLRKIAAVRRRFGYRRLHILLRREGLQLNHKKLRRLYAEERLQVRRRGGRKRALGTRAPLALPHGPNQRWSLDFVHDQLTDGRRFRILAVVDDFTRECPGAGRRHFAVRSTGRARTRCRHCPTRQARRLPLRQRHRADQHGDFALVAGDRRRMALHRTRQAAAERFHRKL